MRASALRYMRRLPIAQTLPNAVRVVKVGASPHTFAVYIPISPDGVSWTKLYFTRQNNVGQTGVPRLVRASISSLWSNVSTPTIPENWSTGAQAQAPTTTVLGDAATDRAGTWTSPATYGGITGIRYSTATGDYVEYHVTGVDRVAMRSYMNASNSGVLDVLITEVGVGEIDASQYCTRSVNTRGVNTGYVSPQLATALNPSASYVVRLTVSSANPSGGRCYDGGLFGYVTDSTAIGAMGPVYILNRMVPARPTTTSRLPGTVLRYSLPNCNKVQVHYSTGSNVGIFVARVRSTAGVELASMTIDGYGVGAVSKKVTVADGLPVSTYILEVESTNSKNAAAQDAWISIVSGVAVNTSLPGNPAVDEFEDYGTNITALPTNTSIQGTGNIEYAIRLRKPGNAPGVADDFITGLHGYEDGPFLTEFRMDGIAIDVAGASPGDAWNGSVLEWTFTTTGRFLDGGDVLSMEWSQRFDRTGWWYEIKRMMLADAMCRQEYVLMAMAPKTGSVEGVYRDASIIDCAFWPSSDGLHAVNNNNSIVPALLPATKICLSSTAAFSVSEVLNLPEICAAMNGIGSLPGAFLQDRNDGFTKCYTMSRLMAADGSLIPAGNEIVVKRRMRFGLV